MLVGALTHSERPRPGPSAAQRRQVAKRVGRPGPVRPEPRGPRRRPRLPRGAAEPPELFGPLLGGRKVSPLPVRCFEAAGTHPAGMRLAFPPTQGEPFHRRRRCGNCFLPSGHLHAKDEEGKVSTSLRTVSRRRSCSGRPSPPPPWRPSWGDRGMGTPGAEGSRGPRAGAPGAPVPQEPPCPARPVLLGAVPGGGGDPSAERRLVQGGRPRAPCTAAPRSRSGSGRRSGGPLWSRGDPCWAPPLDARARGQLEAHIHVGVAGPEDRGPEPGSRGRVK